MLIANVAVSIIHCYTCVLFAIKVAMYSILHVPTSMLFAVNMAMYNILYIPFSKNYDFEIF